MDRSVVMADTEEAAARLAAKAADLVEEALKLDPTCYDAVRLHRYMGRALARRDGVRFGPTVPTRCARDVPCRRARQRPGPPRGPPVALESLCRPYLRWLFDLANERLSCGCYRRALETLFAAAGPGRRRPGGGAPGGGLRAGEARGRCGPGRPAGAFRGRPERLVPPSALLHGLQAAPGSTHARGRFAPDSCAPSLRRVARLPIETSSAPACSRPPRIRRGERRRTLRGRLGQRGRRDPRRELRRNSASPLSDWIANDAEVSAARAREEAAAGASSPRSSGSRPRRRRSTRTRLPSPTSRASTSC